MASLIAPIPFACPNIQIGARGFSLPLPGGASLGAYAPDLFTTNADLARIMLGQVQLVMAPMVPLFNIIQAVLCLKDIVESIPDSITSLNPAKLIEALDKCLPTISKLASLIPQIAVPQTIAGMLDLTITVMEGHITELESIVRKTLELEQLVLQARAPEDPLNAIVECATKLNGQHLCAVNEAMGPMTNLLGMINLFLGLIGQDPIAPPANIGDDPTGAIAELKKAIDAVRKIRKALPIPPLLASPRC